MNAEYSLGYLNSLPTLAVGQTDDLKIDRGNQRVWLSRMTVEDGSLYNNEVTVENFDGNRWVVSRSYRAA